MYGGADLYMENMMRKTAKENKFLNQKDKINELIQKEEMNYVNKYAARFQLNRDECNNKKILLKNPPLRTHCNATNHLPDNSLINNSTIAQKEAKKQGRLSTPNK
jgi:hypothetical protein